MPTIFRRLPMPSILLRWLVGVNEVGRSVLIICDAIIDEDGRIVLP